MRILHVIDHSRRYNGMVHAAVDLACQQSRDGHAVFIWNGGGDFDDILENEGVTLLRAPSTPTLLGIPAAIRSMRRAVRESDPNVIHAHMARSALIAWILSRLTHVSLVTSIQNSSVFGSFAMASGDGMVTGCKAVRDTMVRRGVPARKLRAVLNGTIGSARFADSVPSSVTLQHPAILTICGLHRRKGVDDLIAAFAACRARVPTIHLYVIGDGPSRAQHEKFVRDFAIPNVHFCGYVSDTRPFMASADAFVLASRADPAPLVISEAREAGLAIIATDVDGIPELLEYGEAGLLVRPNAPVELSETLERLFLDENSLSLWRQRSQFNVQMLRVERVAAEISQVYQEVMAT